MNQLVEVKNVANITCPFVDNDEYIIQQKILWHVLAYKNDFVNWPYLL